MTEDAGQSFIEALAIGFRGGEAFDALQVGAGDLERRDGDAVVLKGGLRDLTIGGCDAGLDPPEEGGWAIQLHADSTKLSMTFLVPAFSKAISSLLPSTAMIFP